VELTMTADPLNAALLQLAAHGERLAVLEGREAAHFRAISDRLAAITALAEGLGGTVKDQAAILARLQGLDEDVAALAARLHRIAPAGDGDDDAQAYQPAPAARWWKLTGQARDDAVARLRAWVEQVYRPGYGQLAAALGPCWQQHPLCLYGLDIAAELWSVLYLQPTRTPAVLSAQAEYQTRILPALAEQLITETARCGHTRTTSVNGHARSAP
jgi:hypothetical protein